MVPPAALREGPEPRFGSDRTGELYGYRFAPGRAGVMIPATDEVTLEAESSEGGFVWLHFNLANQAALRWLTAEPSIPDSFTAALDVSRQHRIEHCGRSLVVTMNDLTLVDGNEHRLSSLVACVGPSFLITGRRTPLQCVDRLRSAVLDGQGYSAPIELFAALLHERAAGLHDLLRPQLHQVDAIEDRLIAGDVHASRAALGVLRRSLVRIHRVLAPEAPALAQLVARPPEWWDTADTRNVADATDALVRAVGDCHALADRIKLLQDEVVALVGEQTNRTLFTLTVVTVLALPMTIASGFYGMNFTHMPLQGHPAGFWAVVVCTGGISALGAWLLFRSQRH